MELRQSSNDLFSLRHPSSLFTLRKSLLTKNVTLGYWRRIYHTNVISTPVEAIEGNLREYFVPEMYLK